MIEVIISKTGYLNYMYFVRQFMGLNTIMSVLVLMHANSLTGLVRWLAPEAAIHI